MGDDIRLQRQGDVAYLGFDRPDTRNAYNRAVMEALDQRLREIAVDPSIGCVVLHGDERAFCSGGDLREVLELAEQGADALREGWFEPLLRVTQRLATLPMPTVAAVRGLALAGGLELALCCDLLIVADDARLGDQHINAGLIPGGGATDTLVRRIGAQRAKHLMLTGRRVSGREAAEIGLALWSAPAENFDAEMEGLTSELAAKRKEAARAIKLLVGPDLDPEAVRREQDAAAYDMSGETVLDQLRSFGSGKGR